MPTLTTDGERLLYQILQRANLCQYFEMFISQGGDDVRQLCEAGEEEFLEIMALVGMASKPLHVRRLQKALHEWIVNPGLLQSNEYLRNAIISPKGSIMASVPHGVVRQQYVNETRSLLETDLRRGWDDSYDPTSDISHRRSSPFNDVLDSDHLFSEWQQSCPSPVTQAETSNQLTNNQIHTLESYALEMAKTLPLYAPRPLNMKKPVDKEIDEVMNLPDEYPNRMDLIRKYSAIYGRFDSKKSAEKVLYMHQVLVNEAAAQLCKHRPTLLTRREDLFPLARQVVRDSGLQYSRPQVRARDSSAGDEGTPVKHVKMELQTLDRSCSEHCIDSSELDDSQTAVSVTSRSPEVDAEKGVSTQTCELILEPNRNLPCI